MTQDKNVSVEFDIEERIRSHEAFFDFHLEWSLHKLKKELIDSKAEEQKARLDYERVGDDCIAASEYLAHVMDVLAYQELLIERRVALDAMGKDAYEEQLSRKAYEDDCAAKGIDPY